MTRTNLLTISGLSASYGDRPVIENLSLTVAKGESVAVVGPNGCGKSTLLRAVMAEIVENSGTICHLGRDISHFETDRIIRCGIGYLRQTRNIFPSLTVTENLELAGMSEKMPLRREKVMSALPMLCGREFIRAGLLSGGERQALALAMALMRPVSLLLLDEPVAGLSHKNAIQMLEGLIRLQKEERFGIVIIEHRVKLIRPWVSRVVIMVRGRIAENTEDTTILDDRRRLERHYLP